MGEALESWISVNVEQCVLEEGKVSEADARLAEEDIGHVGDNVQFARALEDGQDAGCRATRTSAHLEGHHAAFIGHHCKHRLDCGHNASVVEGCANSVLVNRQNL